MLKAHSSIGVYLDLFHDWSLVILIFISFLVFSIILIFRIKRWCFKDLVEVHGLEFVWTVIPGIVLMLLVIPSLYGLFLLDLSGVCSPRRTVTVTGRQWYWSYSYVPYTLNNAKVRLSYDSFMKIDSGCDFRNLEVDCPLVIVASVLNRILLRSSDVIHRFAIPQLGFKLDCVPGRLSQSYLRSYYLGTFYGQCSEICGANHSFMPIRLECVPRFEVI